MKSPLTIEPRLTMSSVASASSGSGLNAGLGRDIASDRLSSCERDRLCFQPGQVEVDKHHHGDISMPSLA